MEDIDILLANKTQEYFREIGRRGGYATRARYGREHYERIGKLGGIARARKAVITNTQKAIGELHAKNQREEDDMSA